MARPASARGRRELEDRPSTPSGCPRRTSADVTARIVAARHARRTAWAIAVQLQVPRSTVAAVLARAGLNRLARLTPVAPVVRDERAQPGELVHLDVKPLARIAGIGHRIHGDRRARVAGIGWEYAHVAVDDHSRAAYVEVLSDQTGDATAGFLTRTVAWFAQRGVRIVRVLTDNGGNYRSRRFRRRRRAPHRPPETDPPLSAADQRESRTLHPNATARMGVCAALSDVGTAHARLGPVAPRV